MRGVTNDFFERSTALPTKNQVLRALGMVLRPTMGPPHSLFDLHGRPSPSSALADQICLTGPRHGHVLPNHLTRSKLLPPPETPSLLWSFVQTTAISPGREPARPSGGAVCPCYTHRPPASRWCSVCPVSVALSP